MKPMNATVHAPTTAITRSARRAPARRDFCKQISEFIDGASMCKRCADAKSVETPSFSQRRCARAVPNRSTSVQHPRKTGHERAPARVLWSSPPREDRLPVEHNDAKGRQKSPEDEEDGANERERRRGQPERSRELGDHQPDERDNDQHA